MMDLFDAFKPNDDMMELAAIWLNVNINGTRRLAEGDHVCIEDGWLVSGTHATHKVIGCYGNMASSRLEMMVTDVITNEPKILKLK